MRIFIISFRNYQGRVGGSAGVNYKLFLANQKYRLAENMYHVFYNIQLSEDSEVPKLLNDNKNQNAFKNLIRNIGVADILGFESRLFRAYKWIKAVGRRNAFSENDFYIFQDVESAIAFTKMFKYKKTALAYHQQGSLYYEWKSIYNKRSLIFKIYLDRMNAIAFSRTGKCVFPSKGAIYSLKKMIKSIKIENAKVIYNGTENTEVNLKELKNRCLVFTTVSELNYAKGVDRIPFFMSWLSKNGINYKWIIVGRGKYENKLNDEIQKYRIGDRITWFKEWMSHDAILSLLRDADFYVGFHRTSIFDFTILEAMSVGTVPVLSRVGGNIEIIEDGQSGILIDTIDDFSKIKMITDQKKYSFMSQEALRRQRDLFSDLSFLKGYIELATETSG